MFEKGHPYYGGRGVKGRSGRKKSPRNATRYFNELYDENSFELSKLTIEKALEGDRELLIYCHDRRLGKPKVQAELTGAEGEALGAGLIMKLFQMIDERKRLQEGQYAITGGSQEAIPERVNEEEKV
mgnify:CR=1 FL=1